MESEVGFYTLWVDNSMLMFPLCGVDCCREWLVEHFCLETTAGGCKSVLPEVHFGGHGFYGNLHETSCFTVLVGF